MKGLFVGNPAASPWTHPVVIAAVVAVVLFSVSGLAAILRWMPAAPVRCPSCNALQAARAVQKKAPYQVTVHLQHPNAMGDPVQPF